MQSCPARHDSGTFDQRIASFPERGGANGGIIHDPELNMGQDQFCFVLSLVGKIHFFTVEKRCHL